MASWFECKVSYHKTLENGQQKKVTEPFIVDALSFTEAEARIIEEVSPYVAGTFDVTAVKKVNIAEIFYDETGDKWYYVKYNMITIDDIRKNKEHQRLVSYADVFENMDENEGNDMEDSDDFM